MKDVVQRRKADGDTKVRQLIDLAKIQEAPYSCDAGLLHTLDELLKEKIIASLPPKVEEQKFQDTAALEAV